MVFMGKLFLSIWNTHAYCSNCKNTSMKKVYTGIESSGKSLQLSINAERVLQRNINWLKITGVPRTMAFNQPMAKYFRARIENAGIKYLEWIELREILPLDNADIFIDEIIKYFPATGTAPLTREQMDFLTQGAKNGIHVYGASQDFSQVHKQFRLLVNEVYVITKLLGSKRPMKTAPPVKMIWGICMMRKVRPASFKGDSATMESIEWIPSFFLIEKEDTDRFDTTYKIPMSTLPTKIVRKQMHIGYNEKGGVEYEKTTWV